VVGWATRDCGGGVYPTSYRNLDTHANLDKHVYTDSNADAHFDVHSDIHSDSDVNSQAGGCTFDL